MRIFYGNKATSGQVTTLLSSGSSSGNPASNVMHPFRKMLWTTGSSTAAEYIEFQFPAPVTASSIVLLNHDFTGSDTLSVKANTLSSWGAPPLVASLTVDDQIKATLPVSSYQFWRLDITKASAGAIRNLGIVMIGLYYDTIFAPDYNGYTEEIIDPSRVTKGVGGQTYVETLDKYRVMSVDFSGITQTMKTSIDAISNSIGLSGQCVVQVETSGTLTEPIYCRMKKLPKMSVSGFDSELRYDASLEFEEQV